MWDGETFRYFFVEFTAVHLLLVASWHKRSSATILKLIMCYIHKHTYSLYGVMITNPKQFTGSSLGRRFECVSHTSQELSEVKQAGWCSLTSAKVIRIILLGCRFNPKWQVISCLGTKHVQHTVYLWTCLSSHAPFTADDSRTARVNLGGTASICNGAIIF